jgi:peroxiredoxin Q/BCP
MAKKGVRTAKAAGRSGVGAKVTKKKAKAKPAKAGAVKAGLVLGPQIGEAAPDFELPDQAGKPVRLSVLLGKGPVVLYFYPKASSTGCTAQACAFNGALGELKRLGAQVVGVSPDGPRALAKFASAEGLGFPLLSDEPAGEGLAAHAAEIAKYGVWGEKSMYGKKYMGVVRTTFVLDARGVVVARFDNVKVTEGGAEHTAEVLEAARRAKG